MDIKNVAVFYAAATGGSLAHAARQLDLTAMAVSRRLATLEHDLGVRLLHRTTRAISLTPEGEEFLPYARTMLDASDEALSALQPSATGAKGILRVTAPAAFGRIGVMPIMPALLEANPELRVDLQLTDSMVDLAASGIDVAIRIAPLKESELIAKLVTPNPRVLCASPAYLKRMGVPQKLDDLSGHDRIRLTSMPRWPFVVEGQVRWVRPEGRFFCNSVEGVRTACVQGMGIAMLSYFDLRTELADGSLVVINLSDAQPEELSIWAIMPTRRYLPMRVRVFLESLERSLR
jgi:DNA-binding transcriptional LysR family regulator